MSTQVAVLTQEPQLIVVYDGPRGLPGAAGGNGNPGTPGQSITVMGDWNNQLLYAPGNAVTSRSLLSPGLTALWIVKDGRQPTVGRAPHLEPSEWSEVSAGGAEGGAGSIYRVTQISHPFTTVGQPVARSEATGRYELADARSVDLLAIGVVAEVTSVSEFAVQTGGRLVNAGPFLIVNPANPAGRGSSDWTLGRVYYLSTTPGMYEPDTPAQPGAFFQPAVVPISPTQLVLLTWGPENLQAPVDIPAVEIGAGIVPGREGQLWYRRQDRPGLYVALWDQTRTRLMWVMANG